MMTCTQTYKSFSKSEFEDVIASLTNLVQFPAAMYKLDWWLEGGEWIRKESVINEYCYLILLTKGHILKIYSSVDKATGVSRPSDTDAIRIVVARASDAKPIRPKFTRINRIVTWRKNLKERISAALKSLGVNTTCPLCGGTLYLKTNSNDGSRFLLCSKYPDCKGKRNDGRLNWDPVSYLS